ncbi:MAG: DNA ligase D [Cytophagaceae bacterium]
MSLKEYGLKRNFNTTPEPVGKKGKRSVDFRFFIQKHDARRLHYDLRLEMDGVLKSWAIPKGPSINPADKRLAMMVEDHPLEYGNFEGNIPKDNYGAGTVMLWDVGTYQISHAHEGENIEEELLRMLEKGNLKIIFSGKKIKGEFALVRTQRGKGNEWLLIKKHDEFSGDTNILLQDSSVKSGRSLEEIATAGETWHSNIAAQQLQLDESLKAEMPVNIKPMLATLVEQAFDSEDWVFEIKWDGYRAISELNYDHVELYSRNGNSFNQLFPTIVQSLKELGLKAVLDGEIVAIDEHGVSRFGILQNFKRTGEGNIVYYVFDILYVEGYDLRGLSLKERKAILEKILPKDGAVRYNDHIKTNGKEFFDLTEQHMLEGVIAKKADSPYGLGKRSRNWLKIKTHNRQEAVIVGITDPKGSRKYFGALLLGVYNNGKLEYIGRVGGGFNEEALKDVYDRLQPLFTDKPSLYYSSGITTPVQWVEPVLICEIKFQEWTSDGILRQPIFLGMRDDKDAREVVKEKKKKTDKLIRPAEKSNRDKTETQRPAKGSTRKKDIATNFGRLPFLELNSKGTEGRIELDGQALKLTNLHKLYWPDENISKQDLIEYYYRIAPVILPYLIDRPQSLKRNPNGIKGKGFFQKNMPETTPDWIETHGVWSEHNNGEINYMFCQNTASLVYMANLGCIEINPWSSRLRSLENPDFIVIDLDPQDVPFEQVVETALAVKEVMDWGNLTGCCKTSGSRGLHIYIPLAPKYDYEQGKEFAHLIATLTHQLVPDITSLERSPAKRRNKIYLDYLQNRKGQTLAAPYCVRPRSGATVSTPLDWEELTPDLSPSQFTIFTIFKRLKEKGDLFSSVLEKQNSMDEAIDAFNRKRG